ncbi:MAG: ATP-binding cassette domain-containing protein, partial [Paramuribaculum sp.]|nr:ATP-binding cassette domain-containing protein [Paramuribaculum sp.]
MLTIDSLSFAYRGRHSRKVLDRFSLTLEPGNICGLLGPNGAGKSTLFYLTAGLLTPASGSIDYNGFTPRRRDTAFMSDIFLVPEEIALPSMTLRKFVAVNSPFYPRWSAKAMNRYLDMFELTPDIHFDPLSMGQRKKAF